MNHPKGGELWRHKSTGDHYIVKSTYPIWTHDGRQCDLGRQDHKVERPIRDRRTIGNVPMGMGTDKLGEIMPHYGNQAPQVGDLFVSTTQGRLHILVSYEFVYKDRVDFYKYYDVKLKRLDDGAISRWKVAQHEFYRKYKPLQPDPQA